MYNLLKSIAVYIIEQHATNTVQSNETSSDFINPRVYKRGTHHLLVLSRLTYSARNKEISRAGNRPEQFRRSNYKTSRCAQLLLQGSFTTTLCCKSSGPGIRNCVCSSRKLGWRNAEAESLNLSSPLMSRGREGGVVKRQPTAFISRRGVFVTRTAISGVKEFGLQTPYTTNFVASTFLLYLPLARNTRETFGIPRLRNSRLLLYRPRTPFCSFMHPVASVTSRL